MGRLRILQMPRKPGTAYTSSKRHEALRLPGRWRCWLAAILLAQCLQGGEIAPAYPA
jgi:hypothetical protein